MNHLVHDVTSKEPTMKLQESALLFLLGLTIWVLGTIYFGYTGHRVLETTPARYWISFVTSPLISAAICFAILRWRHIPAAHCSQAMLLLAIPGMIGEAIVLSHLGTFMPRIHEVSGGRYGAFLFITYAVVLGLAEIISLRAA
jgi:hypothetical protein